MASRYGYHPWLSPLSALFTLPQLVHSRWAEATASLPDDGSGGPVLTPEQVSSWRDRGFALVNGIVPEALLAQAKAWACAQGANCVVSLCRQGVQLARLSQYQRRAVRNVKP